MSMMSANPAGGLQGTEDTATAAALKRVHDLLRKRFPEKRAAELSAITKISISGWHKNLREKREPSFSALVWLLRSEFRMELLEALLGFDEFTLMLEEAQLEVKRQELVRHRKALREKP